MKPIRILRVQEPLLGTLGSTCRFNTARNENGDRDEIGISV